MSGSSIREDFLSAVIVLDISIALVLKQNQEYLVFSIEVS
jgi:hypothetical protein